MYLIVGADICEFGYPTVSQILNLNLDRGIGFDTNIEGSQAFYLASNSDRTVRMKAQNLEYFWEYGHNVCGTVFVAYYVTCSFKRSRSSGFVILYVPLVNYRHSKPELFVIYVIFLAFFSFFFFFFGYISNFFND